MRVRGSWFSALHGRSRCDSCRRSLVWYEVVPVFSYVLLRGRCRACLARIAPSHAAAEVAMGCSLSPLLYMRILLLCSVPGARGDVSRADSALGY